MLNLGKRVAKEYMHTGIKTAVCLLNKVLWDFRMLSALNYQREVTEGTILQVVAVKIGALDVWTSSTREMLVT